MAVDPCRTANHDAITKGGATGNSDLGNKHAIATNPDIVRNLHQIVDLGSLTYHRIVDSTSINCRAGADFHMILYDHPSDLGDLVQTTLPRDIAKAILPYAYAGMDNDIVADQRVLHRRSVADVAITTNPCTRTNGGAGRNHGSGSDLGTRTDNREWLDGDVVFQPCGGIDMRRAGKA